MIEMNAEPMKMACEDLCQIAAQLDRIGAELDEILQVLLKSTSLMDIVYHLRKEKEDVKENYKSAIQLSGALEEIIDIYCQVETEVEQILRRS